MKFSGIPYKVVGGAKFYDRREIKDILAFVRVLANPDDEVSARRIVNVPKRGIGDTSVARLAAWAQVEHVSFSEAIDRAEEAGLSGKALKGAEQLSKTLGELRPLVQTVNPADFVQLVADRTGYLAELVAEHTHEADGRIENLAELATQAGRLRRRPRLPRDGGAGGGLRRARQRRHPRLADDAAHGQGPGVPGRVRGGPGGGDLPALPLALRAERARGGAPALLRGDHPGPPAPRHLARLVAHDLGPHPARHAEPLRHRGAVAPGRGRRPRVAPPGLGLRHPVGRGAPARAPIFSPAVPLADARPVPGPAMAVRVDRPEPRDPGQHRRRRPRSGGRATRWCTTTGAAASWSAPRARGHGPRPRCASTRSARRTCCCRPPRSGRPEPIPVWRPDQGIRILGSA